MWWSWILTLTGLVGLYLAGRGRPAGWAVGIAAQILWIFYAIATGQPGFIVAALAYGAVYTRNYVAWRRGLPHPRGDTDA